MRLDNKSIFVWRVMLWIFAALMTACGTAPIERNQTLTGKEGAVVLKLIVNGRITRNAAYDYLSAITLRRVLAANEEETRADSVALVRTRALTQTTAVFSGMIAPGRYRIVGVSGGTGNVGFGFPLASVFKDSFEVRAGEVTLLGTILVQEMFGQNFQVGYLPPEAELTETVEETYPALAAQAKAKPVHSFDMTPELSNRTEIAKRIKGLAIAMNGPTITSNGDIFASGKMGRIIWRKADEQRWRELNVDTWKEVTSVRHYRDGLLASGEQGLLCYSEDDGKTWLKLTSPDKGTIAIAAPIASGKVVAISRRDSEWSVWVSDDVLKGAWRKLGTFAQEHSINGSLVEFGVPLAAGNRVGILFPNGEYRFVDGETGVLDKSATGWTTISATAAPNGMLVVHGRGIGATVLVSTNEGKSWVDLDVSRFVWAIAFVDESTAYAVAPIEIKTFGNTYGLMFSRDKGHSWTQTGQLPAVKPDEVRELIFDKTRKSLFAFLNNGQIMISRDEGKTWARDL